MPGQAFPWNRLSISLRRLRQLYEAGWIMYEEEAKKKQPEPEPEEVVVEAPPAEEEEG